MDLEELDRLLVLYNEAGSEDAAEKLAIVRTRCNDLLSLKGILTRLADDTSYTSADESTIQCIILLLFTLIRLNNPKYSSKLTDQIPQILLNEHLNVWLNILKGISDGASQPQVLHFLRHSFFKADIETAISEFLRDNEQLHTFPPQLCNHSYEMTYNKLFCDFSGDLMYDCELCGRKGVAWGYTRRLSKMEQSNSIAVDRGEKNENHMTHYHLTCALSYCKHKYATDLSDFVNYFISCGIDTIHSQNYSESLVLINGIHTSKQLKYEYLKGSGSTIIDHLEMRASDRILLMNEFEKCKYFVALQQRITTDKSLSSIELKESESDIIVTENNLFATDTINAPPLVPKAKQNTSKFIFPQRRVQNVKNLHSYGSILDFYLSGGLANRDLQVGHPPPALSWDHLEVCSLESNSSVVFSSDKLSRFPTELLENSPILLNARLNSPRHAPIDVVLKFFIILDDTNEAQNSYIRQAVHHEARTCIDTERRLGDLVMGDRSKFIVRVLGVVDGLIPSALCDLIPDSSCKELRGIGIVMKRVAGISLESTLCIQRLHPGSIPLSDSISSSIDFPSPTLSRFDWKSHMFVKYHENSNIDSDKLWDKKLRPDLICEPWKYTDKLIILLDLSRSLSLLHHLGIVHGNIKPSNVFINTGDKRSFPNMSTLTSYSSTEQFKKYNANTLMRLSGPCSRFGNFILNAHTPNMYTSVMESYLYQLKRSIRYIAPELLDNFQEISLVMAKAKRMSEENNNMSSYNSENKNHKLPHSFLLSAKEVDTLTLLEPSVRSDVYSLATLTWELLNSSGVSPYANFTSLEDVFNFRIRRSAKESDIPGSLDLLDPVTPKPLRELLLNCFSSNPLSRPSSLQFSNTLELVYRRMVGGKALQCDVYFSSSWTNPLILRLMKYILELVGFSVWYEESPDLDPSALQQALVALQNCRVFISFLNENYLEMDHTINEFHSALINKKKIINIFSDNIFFEFIKEIDKDSDNFSDDDIFQVNTSDAEEPPSVLSALRSAPALDLSDLCESPDWGAFSDHNLPSDTIVLLKANVRRILTYF